MSIAEAISRLSGQAGLWRAAQEAANDERAKLNELIIEARDVGVPFARIREVTGLGNNPIQMVIAKARKG